MEGRGEKGEEKDLGGFEDGDGDGLGGLLG